MTRDFCPGIPGKCDGTDRGVPCVCPVMITAPCPRASGRDSNPAIMLTREQFDALLEYNCTIPTGTRVGKAWKRRVPEFGEPHVYWRCEYIPDPDGNPKMLGIYQQKILLPGDLQMTPVTELPVTPERLVGIHA